MRNLCKDFRCWILLFFVIRLFGITLPPIEAAQNWRQCNVAMVARNFYETDANIFYPRIDNAGEKTGITGMEFPLLNYLIYLMSLLFGYDHWYGRLINLVVSSTGIWYFYLLVRKYFSRQIAFNAGIILLSSIWFAYSRKIMPDTFSVSFILAGLYFGTNYLDRGASYRSLILSYVLMLLGTLSKLPAAYLVSLFVPLLFFDTIAVKRRVIMTITLVMVVIPVVVWYFYWVPFLVNEYGFWYFFMGKDFLQGAKEIAIYWNESLKNYYENAMKFIGFGAFVAGLLLAIYLKKRNLLIVFILTFVPFLFMMVKAGETFSFHSYYIIPFVPIMALVAGYGLSLINKKQIVAVILMAIVTEGILNQQHDFRIKEKYLPILNLESVLDKYSKPTDLILINSGSLPTPLYFAHRKGWLSTNENIRKQSYRDELHTKGLKFIVILKRSFGTQVELPEHIVFDNENYTVYSLREN
ncbi:MAG: glycosyltransferase family 39 protein [Bacteroidales bacterium]|jgi:4-amino-4-deoxy-L-arabinose transferase-like glycosyltransferase